VFVPILGDSAASEPLAAYAVIFRPSNVALPSSTDRPSMPTNVPA